MRDTDNQYAAFVSEFQANLAMLPRPGRTPHAVECIHNGVDTDFWTPGDTDRTIDVLWTARTDPEKGIGVAIDLVPILCSNGLNYVMVTSEPDGPRQRLLDLEREFPTFRYLSRLSPVDLREMYRRSKIFIQTSSVEGMPATPLEAAACGCWPLCSAVDGVQEVFEDAPFHLIDPPFAATKFAACITEAIEYIRSEYRNDARQLVLDHYSVANMVNGYIDLYERMAACGKTT